MINIEITMSNIEILCQPPTRDVFVDKSYQDNGKVMGN